MRSALLDGFVRVQIRRRILVPGVAAPARRLRRSPPARILFRCKGNGGRR